MHTFKTLCILDVLFYIAYSARYSLFVLMCRKTHITHSLNLLRVVAPGRVAQSVGHLTRKVRGPGFDTRSGNILSFLLPLFQEGQLSVTGESMCTKYWLTA